MSADSEPLARLGFDAHFAALAAEPGDPELMPARVVIAFQDRFQLQGRHGTLFARMTGRFRREANDPLRRPAVGDWVLVRAEPSDPETPFRLAGVLERRTAFIRQAAGRRTRPQVLAANLDRIFVVTTYGEDFNPRRLERYLTAVAESGARPVVVLNKADLARPELRARLLFEAEAVSAGAPVCEVSARDRQGEDALREHLLAGETVALIGSSGVGKSSIVNWLLGDEVQEIGEVRAEDEKGRHTTTHRELIQLPGGVILVDTPGLREIQLWSSEEGLDQAFEDIAELAPGCRFNDCDHDTEPGCAVREALESGALNEERFDAWRKLQVEQRLQDAKKDVLSAVAQKKRDRSFAKLVREATRAKRRRR